MSGADVPVLRVRGLRQRFGRGCARCLVREGIERNYCPRCGTVYALQDVSLDLWKGEVLGIVGESGSGKSTVMRCVYLDQQPDSGAMHLEGWKGGVEDVWLASAQVRRHIRNQLLGKVYQNPAEGLKPDFSSVANVAEKLIAAGERRVAAMQDRAAELLDRVKIPRERTREPPRTYSGGMKQRVQIAKAMANNPPILLLDEVTSGLDLSVQARVLDLIKEIQRELGVSMILVSHDLAVVRMLADRTAVMLDGRIVEQGLTDQILEDPQHPYTQELVHSLL